MIRVALAAAATLAVSSLLILLAGMARAAARHTPPRAPGPVHVRVTVRRVRDVAHDTDTLHDARALVAETEEWVNAGRVAVEAADYLRIHSPGHGAS